MQRKFKQGKPLQRSDIDKLRRRERKLDGNADGVVYMGSKIVARKPVIISTELEAMRFIKSPSDKWLKENPKHVGVGSHADFIGVVPQRFKDAAREAGRPVKILIRGDCAGMPDSLADEKINNWKFYPITEFVLAIMYEVDDD